jgi:TRAP-type C4-dicarboxylate transport system permease small subunit
VIPLKLLKRIDEGLARGEAAIASSMLLAMIIVAFIQAFLRNLTINHIAWANDLLEQFKWADSFLQKGTLWLAFFGASLATHNGKHIGIDVLSRIVPPRVRSFMHACVGLFSAVACFFLGRVFFMAVLNNAADIPLDFTVLLPEGGEAHICDAPREALASAGLSRPVLFCPIRSFFGALGAPLATPDTALQLIVPSMFLVISLRFVAQGIGAVMQLFKPEAPEAPAADAPASEGEG